MSFIHDPAYHLNSRAAGVNGVKSDGSGAVRSEPGLQVAISPSDDPTYVLPFSHAGTVAADVFSLVSAAGKVLRIRRIVLVNPGSETTAGLASLELGTATAIGSGGATPTPVPYDASARAGGVTGGPDVAFTGVAHTGDTTQAAGYIARPGPLITVAVPAVAGGFTPIELFNGDASRGGKTLTVAQSLLVVLRCSAIGAGATGLQGFVEFTFNNA